jgi:hypothetical protein
MLYASRRHSQRREGPLRSRLGQCTIFIIIIFIIIITDKAAGKLETPLEMQ